VHCLIHARNCMHFLNPPNPVLYKMHMYDAVCGVYARRVCARMYA
jgi:hypothetical protein